jgi:hypothetical protein
MNIVVLTLTPLADRENSMAKKTDSKLTVETLTHEEATRKNIPTAEYQSVMQKDDQALVKVSYPRASAGLADEKQARNRDLDPQLVWRGKDQQDWSDLVIHAPPLYIQEKVHPKVLAGDSAARRLLQVSITHKAGLRHCRGRLPALWQGGTLLAGRVPLPNSPCTGIGAPFVRHW